MKKTCASSGQKPQSQTNLVQCATAGSVAASNSTTEPVKSPISMDFSPTQKSSKTSAREETTKDLGLEPYWNELCAQISSQLLLPVETDSPDSGLNSLSTWLASTVEKSWLETKLQAVQKPSLPPTFCPSFTSSLAGSTDSENTVTKSRKIRIYLSAKQRLLVRKWFGVSRYVFNKTVELLRDGFVKANWYAIKTGILNNLPEWCGEVPYQIKAVAIRDACTAVREAKKKSKKTGQIQQVKFRSRKDLIQSCFIPKSARSDKGIYYTKLDKLAYSQKLPDHVCDSRLMSNNGNYYLCIAHKVAKTPAENQGRVVALDPGVRTFVAFFSETSVGFIGYSDFSRIQRLCQHLDNLKSKISKANGGQKRRIPKAARRMVIKIQNLIGELHHKTARFLVDNFDVILLPTFETAEMSKKGSRKIRSKTVRNLLNFAHYRFKEFLKHKAKETGKIVVDVCEAYTSKTVSWTGELVNIGGGKKIKSKVDGRIMDRDINGARGIFLRALGDTPWLPNQLALVSQGQLLADFGS